MGENEFVIERLSKQISEMQVRMHRLEFMAIALREENDRLKKEVNQNAEGIHENHMEE